MIELEGVGLRVGRRALLDDLSFRVTPGAPTALFGGNGAGKSLLLRVLMTDIRPTSGSARIAGFDVGRDVARVRRSIGAVREPEPFPPGQRVRAYLRVFASAHRLDRATRAAAIDDALALTDLTGRADASLETLSRGEAQRLELARALLHDPPVLLLDEPLSGLDPLGQIEMLEVLRELVMMEKTLLIATNSPEQYGDLFARGVLLHAGRIVCMGDLAAFCEPFPDIEPRSWRAALLRHLAGLRDNELLDEAANGTAPQNRAERQT